MTRLRIPFAGILVFLCPSACVFGESANSMAGSVRDPQQAAIPGARVTLSARDNTAVFTVTADAGGNYHFENIAPGSYLLQAAAPGFANSEPLSVSLSGNSRLTQDFELSLAGVQTSVVVTASGTLQTTDELSKSVSVLDAQTLELQDETSVSEALRAVPGLRIKRLGGPAADSSISSRGLPNQDTAVLIDGFRLRDTAAPQGDASSLIEDLVVTDVDRVEVLRGAGSSLYGTNAIGGVVNLVTEEGGGHARGSVLLEGGSLGTFRGRAQTAGGLAHDKLQYSFGITHLNVVNGVDGDDPARITSAQGRLGYRFSSKVRLSGRIFAADSFSKLNDSPLSVGNVPATGIINAVPVSSAVLHAYEQGADVSQVNTGPATYLPSPDNPDYTRAGRFFSGALILNANPTESLGITVDYQGLRTWRRFGDGPAGAGFQPAGSTLSFYDGEVHTAGARVDWRLGRHQSIDAGYEFESETYGNHSLLPDPSDNSTVAASQRSSAFYFQDQVHLLGDRLQLAASYRGQMFALTQPVFTPQGDVAYAGQKFSAPPDAQTGDGSAAYFFKSSGTKIRAHVGRGYRAPSLYERFGTYYSSFGYSLYGDPRLGPERSVSFDGGVDQVLWGNRAKISATYFYTRLQEVIVFDTSGVITPAMDPFGRYGGYRNTNGGLSRGVEFSTSLAATRSTTLRGAYTHINAIDRTPLVPGVLRTYGIPDHQASVALVQRLSPRLTLMFDLLAASNYLAPIIDSVTFTNHAYRFPGMKQARVGASYRRPMAESRAVRLFANVSNLTNQRYDESGFLTPGVTAMGGLQFEF